MIKSKSEEIFKDNNFKKYNVKEININDYSKYQFKEKTEVLIVRENKDGSWIPSQLTYYLKSQFNECSLNTKMKTGRFIANFINYINNEIRLGYDNKFDILKENGLCGLTLYHLASYINSLYGKNNYTTAKDKENTLLKFYLFLYKLGITGEEAKVEEIPVPVSTKNPRNTVRYQMVNPFRGNPKFAIEYPPSNSEDVLKDMDEDVWFAFINYARKHYPHIALGVLMQICGGIRQGELVNLTIDCAELNRDKEFMYVYIDDRQKELFARGVDTRYCQIKKFRNQPVFNFNGELFDVWDEHMEYLKNLKKRTNLSALFIDAYGQPMTAQVYQKEFHKLKWKFINFIDSKKPETADELRVKSWGSHIGRHIYTNYLITNGLLKNIVGHNDPKLLMILRGDSNTKSSEVYLNLDSITKTVASEVNVISALAKSIKIRNDIDSKE